MAKAGEVLGEGGRYSMLIEVLAGTATMETTVAVTQEAKNLSTSRSNCTNLGHIPEGITSYYRDVWSTIFIAFSL